MVTELRVRLDEVVTTLYTLLPARAMLSPPRLPA